MLIVYVGHDLDGVEIDGVDIIENDEGLAKPGQPVEVPDDIAGHAPVGHRADVDEHGVSTFDPGSGLLAQTGNWQPYVDPGDPLEAMKLPDLKTHAAANSIDLGDAKTKPDILAAIRGAAPSEGSA